MNFIKKTLAISNYEKLLQKKLSIKKNNNDNSSNKNANQQNKSWKLYIWPTTFTKMKQMAIKQPTFSKTTKDHVFLCMFFFVVTLWQSQ